jgi:choice-of-anchor A domain-containing protein
MSQNLRTHSSRWASRTRNTPRHMRCRPIVDSLEARVVPTSGVIGLADAAEFAVLGLKNTRITDFASTVRGDEGVSQGGRLTSVLATIGGNVTEASRGQYDGLFSRVKGKISVDSALTASADQDALAASLQDAALPPTQTFTSINRATTVNGNGGLNVIAINGNLRGSLTLRGAASDVFVVNVSGNASLTGGATLKLAGGVTADHVLYNFTGNGGSVTLLVGGTISGTILAPHEDVTLDGNFVGEVVGGGRSLTLLPGATVSPAPFVPTTPSTPTSLSGAVFGDVAGISGVTVTLTGTESDGVSVSLQSITDSSGAFTFTNLQPGTYTILAPQVAGGTPLAATGSVNGTFGDGTIDENNDIIDIVLQSGDNALDYNFNEIFADS